MPNVFIATLGQRPEAVTIAFDLLRERCDLPEAVIMHTDPQHSGIAKALTSLRQTMREDYPDVDVAYHEIRQHNGAALLDIRSHDHALDYFRGVYALLLHYKQHGFTLHFLISGGRKAMSVYAAMAAALVFKPDDRLWTVLSPPELIDRPGQFHIPAGLRDDVQLISLPLVTARIAPGAAPTELLHDPVALVDHLQDRRGEFLQKLSREERRLVELLEQYPDATDQQLANLLSKSERTVENQLRGIYIKMESYLTFGERVQHKRQTLLGILRGVA